MQFVSEIVLNGCFNEMLRYQINRCRFVDLWVSYVSYGT